MSLVFNLKKVFTLNEVVEILAEQLSMHVPITESHLLDYALNGFLSLSLELKDPLSVRETPIWYEDTQTYCVEEIIRLDPGLGATHYQNGNSLLISQQ